MSPLERLAKVIKTIREARSKSPQQVRWKNKILLITKKKWDAIENVSGDHPTILNLVGIALCLGVTPDFICWNANYLPPIGDIPPESYNSGPLQLPYSNNKEINRIREKLRGANTFIHYLSINPEKSVTIESGGLHVQEQVRNFTKYIVEDVFCIKKPPILPKILPRKLLTQRERETWGKTLEGSKVNLEKALNIKYFEVPQMPQEYMAFTGYSMVKPSFGIVTSKKFSLQLKRYLFCHEIGHVLRGDTNSKYFPTQDEIAEWRFDKEAQGLEVFFVFEIIASLMAGSFFGDIWLEEYWEVCNRDPEAICSIFSIDRVTCAARLKGLGLIPEDHPWYEKHIASRWPAVIDGFFKNI